MDETRIRIGNEVLFAVDINTDWYISSMGYDGKSVGITLRKKSDRENCWIYDGSQTMYYPQVDGITPSVILKDKPHINDFFRNPTEEEMKSVNDYIDSISIPTGVNVFDFMDEPKTKGE